MRKGTFTLSLCVFLCIGIISDLFSQVPGRVRYEPAVNNAAVEDLVIDTFIANQCFEVPPESINFAGRVGNNASIGYFSDGNVALGMESGLVIANAEIGQFFGGNTATGIGNQLNIAGDPNLSIIEAFYGGTIGGAQDVATFDAGFIEFDFIPTSESVSFTYVFASEEYCDFVATQFNDKFGIFLAGPGITAADAPFVIGGGQPAINIAEFTDAFGNIENVSINNINHDINPNFYVDNNIPGTSQSNNCTTINTDNNPHVTLSQFDGWTIPLQATYDDLEICETYTVRISVADGSDQIFGSAVFLQTSSFNAAEGSSIAEVAFDESGEQFTYEGCGDSIATICFEREEIFGTNSFIDIDMPISIQQGGNPIATFGLDYDTELPLAGSISIGPFGLKEQIVVLSDDRDGEGVEEIRIEIQNPCFCDPQEFILEIIDVPPIEVAPLVSDTSCFGLDDRELTAFVIGGGFPSVDRADPPEDFMYVWSDENGVISNSQTTEVDLSEPGSYTYFLEVSDGCGGVHMDTVNFVTSGIPDAELVGESSICPESPFTILDLTLVGSPPWTLQYTLDGVAQPPLLIEDPDFEFEVSESGTYVITRIDGANCGQDVEGMAIVADQSFDLQVEPTPTLCSDSEDGMLMAVVANGTGMFEYLWSDDNAQTTEMAMGLAPGFYTVTVTDELGCTQELMGEVVAAPEVAVTPALISGTTCGDLSSGEVSAEGTGGNGSFTYEWFDNAGMSVGTGSTIDGLTAGDYEVLAIDENGCEIRNTINIPSDENTPDAFAMPTVIDCNNSMVTITTDGTSLGSEFEYAWTVTGAGSIASGADSPNAVIDEPGTYTLTVTNTTNGCTAQAPVVIADNRVDPAADAGTPFECIDTEVMLGGTGLATGPNITYEWTTVTGGAISGATDIANPMVSEAGTYQVLVTNTENGCTAISQVDVSVAPEVATEMPLPIDCRTDGTVTLSGLGSDTGADITYEWIASNGGVIVSGNNSINPVVSQGGTYSLVVSNSATGCSSPAMEVVVQDIRTDLVAEPGQPAQINCNIETVLLGGGNTSTGGTIEYEWQITPTNGAPSTANTPTVTATQGGTYTLLVTDTSNGCTAMNQVVIAEDTEDPEVVIAIPATLTCEADNQILNSTGSSQGDFTYTWTTMGGNIVSSSSDQNVQIDDPGMYTLTIVNNATGCENSETVEVIEDAIFPEVIIAAPMNIDCDNTQVLLDGSGSESGPGIEYTWRNEAGDIIGSTPSVQVDAGGQYILEVNNTNTGCIETDPVMVMDIREDPIADVGAIQGLNCDITAVTLGGTNLSTGTEFSYAWSLTGAGVISTDANPEIVEGGEYTLVVTNSINGCTATNVVVIAENMEDPEIDVDPSGVITCEAPTQQLLTDGSSTGSEFVYTWTGPNGFMSNLENPDITLSGTYELTILNTTNMCSVSEMVEVEEDADFPEINIETPAVVNCANTIIELSGEGSELGPDIMYTWVASNGGVIEDDEDTLNPEISAAGTYTLTVSNTASGCSRTEEIVVTDDFADPEAMVNPDLTFGCTDDVLNVTGDGSSTGANIEYEWSAVIGNISGSTSDLSTQIDQPGEYILLVTDTNNGCTAMATLMVTPDEALPEIAIAPADLITCDRPTITIDATGSATGSDLTFQWERDGTPFTPDDNLVFDVDQPGMYTLIIEDTNNGCVSEQTIPVMENVEDPIAEAGEGIVLNCRDMMLNLDAGESSSGDEFEYSWIASNGGVIVSGEDTDEPLVSEPGTYTLTVRNIETGCTSTDEVPVLRNDFEPEIAIVSPGELNCRDQLITIDAMGSDQGGNFEIEWTEMGTANIESGEETLSPVVDAPGTYILTITNMDNFCVSTEEIVVTENIENPDAAIEIPEMLTCATLDVTLDGMQSSQGAMFTYTWSSPNGSFSGSTNEINTVVDGPGIYELLVVNTENFCENTFSIEVFQDIENPTAETGPTQVVTCDETLAQLSGAGSSTGPQFEYLWTPLNGGAIVAGGNTLTPTVDSPGDYELRVINVNNGCVNTSVQQVTSNDVFPQEAPPVPLVLNCEIVTQTLTSQANPGLSYEWTDAANNVIGTGNSVEIDQPGIYIMNITDNVNGCSTPNQFEVFQDIEDPEVNAGPTSELTCTETIAALVGTGSEGSNFTYSWTTTDGSFSGPTDELEAFANAGGTYTLTIFNEENRCSSSSSVMITVDEDTPSGIEADAISPMCFGDPGAIFFDNIIGGVGPFMYSIDGGQTFSDEELFSNLEPGVTYDLLIEDDNGCTVAQQLTIPTVDSLSVTVAETMVEIELGETLNINATTTFPEEEIVSITWTPSEGLSCTDCLSPQATPGFSGSYEVMVVSENGCVDNATIQFRVDRSIDIYIPNAFSPHNDDGINDLFMPFGKPSIDATVLSFQIYDRWGEQVFVDGEFQLNDPARGWNGVFRETDSPTGVYVYYIVLEFVDGSTELFEGDVTLMN